ncbi:Lon protease [Clostridium acetireducens DSM 10703]|uniref:endopeptidase La n=1 Tax=Clostridium acetireducens DSM 10703 TaxID=1121290 RepID=A0A1E8F2C9_9CLOT|nr:AAA family ATPase [Clostridium acetireducens]OFI07534.1 Lon protease [Clostridium acetireducens DSM 10703]
MRNKLKSEEVVYKFDLTGIKLDNNKNYMPEYEQVYENIKTALQINKFGYNVYLIDDFSMDKLNNITDFIKENVKNKEKPKDICYVIYEDEKSPEALFLKNGKGNLLKKTLHNIQEEYSKIVINFYLNSSIKEKEEILENMQKKRNEIVGSLIEEAEESGFQIKVYKSGFKFLPTKDGKPITEKEYEILGEYEKEEILNKLNILKKKAQNILIMLEENENKDLNKIKKIMKEYLSKKIYSLKENYKEDFKEDKNVIEYLNFVCNKIGESLANIYSINYDDDEELISKSIYKYDVNVIVDNSKNSKPPIIFEEDPSVNNLLGSIEYENRNGIYVTDLNLIKSGALLKANGGCLILRVNSLFSNANAYYYLKKSLLSGKVRLDYNRGYLELLSLSGLNPKPIDINETVILVGDYSVYDLLYSYDEDFKKIFKIKSEYNPIIDINKSNKEFFVDNIYMNCKKNNLKPLTDDAIKELAKYLSRKAEYKNKLYMDNYELNKILILANSNIEEKNQDYIEKTDIINIVCKEEILEKEVLEKYKENTLLIDVKDKSIGQINGLSVIDMGYYRFGRPIKITCSCYNGTGNIIDIQKESNLSGNIHNKAINTLRGYINTLVNNYEVLPVDFHLNFEQIYGKVDGDSASVAEAIAIISALSKIPIKQNIAVTGSVNQFGKVQPIGGVNDKIEGFFKVCKTIDTIENKGVLIPKSNTKNLVLNEEVEKSIQEGKFNIYYMENMKDAVEILLDIEERNKVDFVLDSIEKEVKKYSSKKRYRR